ncbi:MAG: CotH kinase family protein [Bacteroidota bacterium]
MRIFLSLLLVLAASTFFAQDLYDTDQVTTIEITFQDDNWNQTLLDFQAAGNGERLMAEVEINGEQFDSVGIRFRGGSTFHPDNIKNPINIKLDYLKNQDFQGYEVLKLSNGAKDPSWMREVLGFEMARQYMEAPKANFTSVYVNGNYLGLYANVESINSKFFRERFQSDADNTRFEANPSYDFDIIPNPPFGCSEGHGAALEFLGPSDVCYFPHYELQSALGWSELRELAMLLQNNPDDVRDLMDFDRFIWMSVFNNLTANLDSYLGASPRNYFIFKTDNGHWIPVIDDLNESLARFPWLTIPGVGDPQPGLDFYTELPLFQGENDTQKPLLSAMFNNPITKNMYVAHMRTMINQLFVSGWFEERVMALQSLINAEVQSDDNHFYSYDDFVDNYNETVIDSYDGEDAYGLFPLMDARIAFLLSLPAFQATPPGISNVNSAPDMPIIGSQVNITAAVANGNTVWVGYRNNRTEIFQLENMFDDGNHGDGAAGDGIFGATVTVPVGGLEYYIYAENAEAGMFSPEKAEFEFYELSSVGEVVINEIMASNQTSISDQDGEFDDWAELYNNSPNTINLSGWYLSDDFNNLTKYQFPNGVVINPDSYLNIWVDDDEMQSGLHATFNLNADGEALILVRPDLSIADQVVFGPQITDVAYGRCPNGWGAFEFLSHTFGTANTFACLTDTEEVAERIGLKLFPNPVSGQLTIETDLTGEIDGVLWSSFGLQLKTFRIIQQSIIELTDVPPGIYFLSLEGGSIVRKVVVQ